MTRILMIKSAFICVNLRPFIWSSDAANFDYQWFNLDGEGLV
jgi:hypothetical protein